MLKQFWNWLTKEYRCDNCELLKDLLEQERRNNRLILDALLEQTKPVIANQEVKEEKEIQPIRTGHIPWSVKQQMLEAESRAEARILQERLMKDTVIVEEVEKLEKELGVG